MRSGSNVGGGDGTGNTSRYLEADPENAKNFQNAYRMVRKPHKSDLIII